MSLNNVAPFFQIEHARPGTRPLFKGYCRACGLFIGASTDPKLMRLAERAHNCQQSSSRSHFRKRECKHF